MIKLLLHESKRRVGSPGVFITPGTYFMIYWGKESIFQWKMGHLLELKIQVHVSHFFMVLGIGHNFLFIFE